MTHKNRYADGPFDMTVLVVIPFVEMEKMCI